MQLVGHDVKANDLMKYTLIWIQYLDILSKAFYWRLPDKFQREGNREREAIENWTHTHTYIESEMKVNFR